MATPKRLPVNQPQVPERIKVKRAEKKPVTVVLKAEDFEPGDMVFAGLSVTLNVNISMSTRRQALGLDSELENVGDDPKAQQKLAFKAMDIIKNEIILDWNLDDDDGSPYPISKLDDLDEDLFKAVMKAMVKGLGVKQLSPN